MIRKRQVEAQETDDQKDYYRKTGTVGKNMRA